jgi:peptidoglycan/LPS O-acetylase OafA/YrhL
VAGRRATGAAGVFRPDIQGLRAIAVLLVVGYHLWPRALPGGYVGVDVFFVISGYLITSLLVKDVEASGSVSFSRFYIRRARRLLPASLVTLAGILAATWLLLPPLEWRDTAEEVAASALYVENWRLAAESVDYLAADSLPSLTQHFWSLSVEEQFYLGWPMLLFLVTLLARALPSRLGFRRVCAAVLVGVVGASLAWSIGAGLTGSATAYFSTFTRVWQLASGGLLAVLAAPPGRWDRTGLVAGLAAILASALWLSDTTAYPGYAALLPTGGALLAVQCGRAHAASLATRWMALWPVQIVGDVSYSLYLWHWPLVAIHAYRTGEEPGPIAAALLFAGSMALAWLSKRFVEDPFRGPRRWPAPAVLATAALATAACLSLALLVHRGAGAGGDLGALSSSEYPGAAALRGAAVPAVEFRPRLVDIGDDVASAYHDDCIQENHESEVATCVYGPRRARRRIALVGDSYAIQWLPALEEVARSTSLQVVAITKTSCAFSLVPPYHTTLKRPFTECSEWTQNVIDYLARERFDQVLIAMSAYHVLGADMSARESRDELARGVRRALDAVAGTGNPLAVLRPTPRQRRSPRNCVSRGSPPYDRCAARRSRAVWNDALTTAATAAGSRLLDFTDLFCPGDRCPPVIGNVFVYRDRHHVTASYMRTLAPMLAERLGLSAGGAGPP